MKSSHMAAMGLWRESDEKTHLESRWNEREKAKTLFCVIPRSWQVYCLACAGEGTVQYFTKGIVHHLLSMTKVHLPQGWVH